MMNSDDIYFQLMLMPFQSLGVHYEIKKQGNEYEAFIRVKDLRKVFTGTLTKMSAVKTTDGLIRLIPTSAKSNIEVNETQEGVNVELGDIARISLTDNKLVEKLRETFQERLGKEVTVNLNGEFVVISCSNPSRVFLNVLNSKDSPFKMKNGKLTFEL